MQTSLKPLNQQVVVITGASSGIGLATAMLAAERGAKLVLIARSAKTLKHLVARIANTGGTAIDVVADVADREKMRLAAQAAVDRFGHIDTWINNAGVAIYGRLDEVNEADSRRLFDTNFWVSSMVRLLPCPT
ncbi:short chain dehydrogenase [Nitrosospira multiformis]|uniref:Short chain dehydrogenase n=1 Tax=Nitrosospira multiformis TaxID=1231 RepID=A0A1I0CVN9_9PROT|nr:short chain dehydrogenase [Nitrosospira multiformis]